MRLPTSLICRLSIVRLLEGVSIMSGLPLIEGWFRNVLNPDFPI